MVEASPHKCSGCIANVGYAQLVALHDSQCTGGTALQQAIRHLLLGRTEDNINLEVQEQD